MFACFSLS